MSHERPEIASHHENTISDEWCKDNAVHPGDFPVMDSYEARVLNCNEDYSPSDPDEHWPLVKESVAHAGLAGFFKKREDRKTNFRLTKTDLVDGNFARALLANTPFADGLRLHSGLDWNWVFEGTGATDPDFVHAHGALPADGHICFGREATAKFIGEVVDRNLKFEIPLSCDDDAYRICGKEADTADGCNPAERLYREAATCKDDCDVLDCGIFDFACDAVTCGVKTTTVCPIAFVGATLETTVVYPVGVTCAAFGSNCLGDANFIVYREELTDGGKLEHELEYRVQDGMAVSGECGSPECTPGHFLPFYRFEFDDFPVVTERPAFLAVTDDVAEALGEVNEAFDPRSPNRIWPFTWAPGIFTTNQGIWTRVAPQGKGQWEAESAIPILGTPLRDLTIGKRFDQELEWDEGFRYEFLGDLIVDCGHSPLHTELHPPSAVLVHASAPLTRHAKRYSFINWTRFNIGGSASFDFWPGTPVNAGTEPVLTELLPFDTSVGQTGIDCRPFPDRAPSRIRCIVDPGIAKRAPEEGERCDDNPRMRPDCFNGIEAGLVEVSWGDSQPCAEQDEDCTFLQCCRRPRSEPPLECNKEGRCVEIIR